MNTSHRDRKKQQTRQALIDSAYELFASQGYESTTLADITARANCAPRTFFRYFKSKENLLLVGIDELWEDLARHLKNRPPETTTLQVIHTWATRTTKEFLENNQPLLHVLNQEIANIRASGESRRQLYSITRMQEVLVPEFAKDLGLSPDDTEPRLIAAATAAVFDAYHNDAKLAKVDELTSIDTTIRILEGAVNSISRRHHQVRQG